MIENLKHGFNKLKRLEERYQEPNCITSQQIFHLDQQYFQNARKIYNKKSN